MKYVPPRMMTITQAISELLYVRDSVAVPGLGTFVTRRVSAKRNAITHELEPPHKEITFDAIVNEDNDILINHICATTHISYDEVEAQLSQFVSDCMKDIDSGKTVKLDGIGTLSNNVFMELEFEQDMSVNYNPDAFGLPTIELTPVSAFEDREQKLKQMVDQHDPRNDIPDGVDIITDDEGDDGRRRPRLWLWLIGVLLFLVLVMVLLIFAVRRGYHKALPKPLSSSLEKIELLFRAETPVDDRVEQSPENDGIVALDSIIQTISDSANIIFTDTIIHDVDTIPLNEVLEPHIVLDSISDTEVDTKVEPTSPAIDKPYYVIGGCFSQEQNALVLVSELQSKGYPDACLAGQNKKGLWLVAYGAYSTNNEAFKVLSGIRETDGNAWILKK